MYSWKVSLLFRGWVFTMALSSAVQQHVFVLFWHNLICPFLLFCCELFECSIQKVFAYAYIFKYFPLPGSVSSFKLKPISVLSRLLLYMPKMGMWVHSFTCRYTRYSNTVCWRCYLSPIKNQMTVVVWVYSWGVYFIFYFITLVYMSGFMPLTCCFLFWWLCSIISD